MKKIKKIMIAACIILVLAVGAVFGIRYAIRGGGGAVVDVFSMDLLNNADYYWEGEQLTGTLTSKYVQEVYVDEDRDVKDVYVKQGDTVKEGDNLLKYNVDEEELDLKLQDLQIKSANYELEEMEKELEKLKNTKAVASTDGSGPSLMNVSLPTGVGGNGLIALAAEVEEDPPGEPKPLDSLTDVGQHSNGEGTEASPYEYSLKKNAPIAGSVILGLIKNNQYAMIKEYDFKGDDGNLGDPLRSICISGSTVFSEDIDEENAYTIARLLRLQNDNPPEPESEHLRKSLTGIEQSSSGKGTEESPYVYELVKGAPIKGLMVRDLMEKGKYAWIYEYESEEAYNSEKEPIHSIFISGSTLFTENISTKARYEVADLLDLLITTDSVTIKPKKKNLKSVDAGKSYKFKVKVKGTNTENLPVTWTVRKNKSSSTTIADGVLNVASDETAASLKIVAYAGGKMDSLTIKVKRGSGGTGGGIDLGDGGSVGDGGGGDTETYTAEELKQEIADKEEEIAQAKQALNESKVNYEEAKKEVNDAVVKATVGGEVTVAYTKDGMPDDGSAAIVVRADDGMYVQTTVSEMLLDTVKAGGVIRCVSDETGDEYEAVIKEVSDYPVSNAQDMYSVGNPNSSYYPVVAYIKDGEDISTGQTVTISYDSQSMGTADGDVIYLQKAYIRTEGQKRYVYKEGKNKRLEKQYVTIGNTLYGQYMEVVSGLTLEDNIAFPYGKNVKEGAKVRLSDDDSKIIY